MSDFIRRRAKLLKVLAGALALGSVLMIIRSGLGWVEQRRVLDDARAEYEAGRALVQQVHGCLLGDAAAVHDVPGGPDVRDVQDGQDVQDESLRVTWQMYTLTNPEGRLRECQRAATADQGRGVIVEYSAHWVVTPPSARPEEQTLCTYLAHVEQRLASLAERANIDAPALERVCTESEWPALETIATPVSMIPSSFGSGYALLLVDREHRHGHGHGGTLYARLGHETRAYGARVREQVLARLVDGTWQWLREPLDAIRVHWPDTRAFAVTRGSPQHVWLSAGADDNAPETSQEWRQVAALPDGLLAQDMGVAELGDTDTPAVTNRSAASEPAGTTHSLLTLMARHHESRHWYVTRGDADTGALTTVAMTTGQNPVGQNPADDNPTGQNPTAKNPAASCRPHITSRGHAVLACLEHEASTSTLRVYHQDPGSQAVEEQSFTVPSAVDADVIDACSSDDTVWLATRVDTLLVSRDSGHTWTQHQAPALEQGQWHCDDTTWSWVGEVALARDAALPGHDDGLYHYVVCHVDAGCEPPVVVGGRSVARAILSADGDALLLIAHSRGALVLEDTRRNGALRPRSVHFAGAPKDTREQLGWRIGDEVFLEHARE